MQTAVEKSTGAAEKPHCQIRSAREEFRKCSGLEQQCGEAIKTGELGGLRPSASTLERKSGGERSRDHECEYPELR